MTRDPEPSAADKLITARRQAMSAFAQAQQDELLTGISDTPGSGNWSYVRKPEIGLIMTQGRIGGSGAPFNIGEVTVTRCAVVIASGETGHATIMGRDREKARLAALADALWQNPESRPVVEARIVSPIVARLAADDALLRAEADATKVDFYTMARGED
ncbi:MAG: phosphonate C-P lyase system protein PhnG [Pseudomonadota bacterium]